MTEEQYKVLEKYEQTLNNALRNSFLRMTPNEFNEVAEVYDQLFTPLRKTQRACNTCRLNALKTLGRAYNAEKEKRLAEEAKKEEEKQEEKPAETPKTTKVINTITNAIKKVGRPKKIDLSE